MSDSLNSNALSRALVNERASAQLVASALGLSDDELNPFISLIDESPYDLNEWARALIEFETWCSQNQRNLQLSHQLEYLNCCSESARGGVRLPLAFLLADFLRNNGVE
jgi:hypothetical protein